MTQEIRLFVLDSRQIAELFHDYIAENGRDMCFDKSLNETGSYLSLEKGNVRAICMFSEDFSADMRDLLNRLPHTGFRNIVLTKKQVAEITEKDKTLGIEDIRFAPNDGLKVGRGGVRIMTLNETEVKQALFGQILKFVGGIFKASGDGLQIGMQVEFDGDDSQALFYYGDERLKFDFEKLRNLTYRQIKHWDFRYTNLQGKELQSVLK